MKEIQLTKGKTAIVDDEDYEMLSGFKWHAVRSRDKWYAETTLPGRRNIKMHYLLLPPVGNKGGDHINGNSLDNRRENLRRATQQQNNFNRIKGQTIGGRRMTSRFKGVSWDSSKGKWRATVSLFRRQLMTGRFDDEYVAARSYDVLAQHLFGEFACLNFPIAQLPGC